MSKDRPMRLRPVEPEVPVWERIDDAALQSRLESLLGASPTRLILVDGRSGAGKTTWAERIASFLEGSVVVHTDELAWNHDAFAWDDLLLDEVVGPWRRREAVSYVPPGWITHGRSGSIEIPAVSTLVVEGVGSGRATLAAAAQATIWVQSDRDAAHRRGIERDIELGRTRPAALAFWHDWMQAEDPFQDASGPWSRADLILRGTSDEPFEVGHGHVAAGPLSMSPRGNARRPVT